MRSPTKFAAEQGLATCHHCLTVSKIENTRCPACNTRLYLRKPNCITRTLALLITASLFYIPANLFPIMTTTLLGNTTESTIIGGVVLFIEHGSYFIAAVIFTASIAIPSAKILAILWLCYAVKREQRLEVRELALLYRITEFIGKWSMIDIFVVALLVALVHITGMISIQVGVAARAFSVVVIATMLAAQAFDIRLLWDKART